MVATPFELTGALTSIADGEDFMEALVDAHPGWLTMQLWGAPSGPATRLGMFTVTCGTGPVGVTLIGSIHGEEPSGREACMAIARDLAETTDPTMLAYLADYSVSIMSTANPHGRANNIRFNANGEDLNRNYDTLDEPETVAIGAWMDWAEPVLTVDLHEMVASTPGVGDFQVSSGTMPDDGLAALLPLGDELNALFGSALVAAGYTWAEYPTISDGTIRRDGPPRWKAVVQLNETNRIRIPTLGGRIDAHRLVVDVSLEHHRLNAGEYEAAHVAAGGGTVPPPDAGRFIVRGGVAVPVVSSIVRGGVLVPLG